MITTIQINKLTVVQAFRNAHEAYIHGRELETTKDIHGAT